MYVCVCVCEKERQRERWLKDSQRDINRENLTSHMCKPHKVTPIHVGGHDIKFQICFYIHLLCVCECVCVRKREGQRERVRV